MRKRLGTRATSRLKGCKKTKTVKRTVCSSTGKKGKVVCRKKNVKVCVRPKRKKPMKSSRMRVMRKR